MVQVKKDRGLSILLAAVAVGGVAYAVDGVYGLTIGADRAAQQHRTFVDETLKHEEAMRQAEAGQTLTKEQRSRRQVSDAMRGLSQQSAEIMRTSALMQIVQGAAATVGALIAWFIQRSRAKRQQTTVPSQAR